MLPITGFEDVPVLDAPRVSASDMLRSGSEGGLFVTYHPAPAPAPRITPGENQAAAQPLGSWLWSWWRGSDRPSGDRAEPSWWERLTSSLGSFFTAPFRWAKSAGLWLGGGLLIVLVVALIALVFAARLARAVEA